MSKYSEGELILPSLYLLNLSPSGNITTSELVSELRELLKPSGEDIQILAGRKDDKFSQIVRNLVSHKTLTKLGYAEYVKGVFSITNEGRKYLVETEFEKGINLKYNIEDFEGEATLLRNDITHDNFLENNSNTNNFDETYPNALLNIERVQFSVYELKRKLEKKKLIIDPDFQRKDVWRHAQKSELIESVLMNIPLPFIYLKENKNGELIVVDGKQRLSTLFEYIDKSSSFKLDNKLKILINLRGKKFSDLDNLLQGILEDYQLISYVIKPPTSDRVIIDIFDRVNRSGTMLNNQEIRNALYQGKSTELLNKLSLSQEFILVTDNSVKNERMKDKYLIIRFLSFYIWRTEFYGKDEYYDYKGDTEDFLPKYMEYINGLDDANVNMLENIFKRAMTNTYHLLGKDGFRLPNRKNITKKRPINMALFESLGYLMAHEKIKDNEQFIKDEIVALLGKEEFIKSFLSIDSTVKYRYEEMDNIINHLA